MSAWEDRLGKNLITAMEMRDLINYESQNLWRTDKRAVKIITDLKLEFDREFMQFVVLEKNQPNNGICE